MPLLKTVSISRALQVGKFIGHGFLNLATARGDVKMYHGDHIVEVPYSRAPRVGEPGFGDPKAKPVQKKFVFVLPEDAAKALGIFLTETVEEETARVIAEQQAQAEAARAAEAAKAAAESKGEEK